MRKNKLSPKVRSKYEKEAGMSDDLKYERTQDWIPKFGRVGGMVNDMIANPKSKVGKLADKMLLAKNRISAKVKDIKNTDDTFRMGVTIYRTNPDGSATKVIGVGKKKLPIQKI